MHAESQSTSHNLKLQINAMHIKMRFDAHHAKFSCNSLKVAGMWPLLGNDDGNAFALCGEHIHIREDRKKEGTC